MSEDQRQQINKQLWGISNLLRGKIDADDYRDYILGFIFYKYLSDKLYYFANNLLKNENVDDYYLVKDPEMMAALQEECTISLGYFLKPEELFTSLTKRGKEGQYILDDLQAVLNHIEQSTSGTESEDDFNALFEDIDLNSTKLGKKPVEDRNPIVVQILSYLDQIDFRLDEVESDVIGDAYEYLIAQFASGAGKKAGEFYTPQQVSKILAKIITTGKTKLKSVYDPTCGSGSLLLRVAKEAEVTDFYGQEQNRTTFNLARMNMILHGVHYRDFDIRQGDTLEEPLHTNKRFEGIVANPPFSLKWKGEDNPLYSSDERFSQYGKLAPKSKADFAFVQHMAYQLADNGTMACVLPHGVLFRGSSEEVIRRYLIKDLNYLDAVIGLPSNIFYGTGIPTCILVLKKCREQDDNIVFIDASGDDYFIKEGNQNTLRDEDVELIVNTYRNRESIDKYSSVVTLEEIEENDYNLNIPRYVDTFEEEEDVDLEQVSQEIQSLEKELTQTNQTIQSFCKELNISTPF